MAVYTLVSSKDLKILLKEYNIGQLTKFIGITEGVENSNYILDTTTGKYILTIFEKRIDLKDMPYYLKLLNHLNKNNIKCPLPIKRNDGAYLSIIQNKNASIFTYLDGCWSSKPSTKQCELLGTALANLHNAGKDFYLKRKNNSYDDNESKHNEVKIVNGKIKHGTIDKSVLNKAAVKASALISFGKHDPP